MTNAPRRASAAAARDLPPPIPPTNPSTGTGPNFQGPAARRTAPTAHAQRPHRRAVGLGTEPSHRGRVWSSQSGRFVNEEKEKGTGYLRPFVPDGGASRSETHSKTQARLGAESAHPKERGTGQSLPTAGRSGTREGAVDAVQSGAQETIAFLYAISARNAIRFCLLPQEVKHPTSTSPRRPRELPSRSCVRGRRRALLITPAKKILL